MLTRVGRALGKLMDLGISPSHDEIGRRTRRLSNALALLTAALCFFGFFVALPFLGEHPTSTLDAFLGAAFLCAGAFALVPWMNLRGWHVAARETLILIASLGCVAGYMVHGPESGAEIPLIPIVFVVFMLFGPRERAALAVGITLPVLSFAFILFTGITPQLERSDAARIYRMVATVSALAGTLAVSFYFFRELWRTHENQRKTLRLVRDIENHIDEAFWIIGGNDWRGFSYRSPLLDPLHGLGPNGHQESPEAYLAHVHPEDAERIRRLAASPPRTPFEARYRIQPPEKGERWLWTRCFPVLDDTGGMKALYGVTMDVTREEETRAVMELQHAQMLSSAKLSVLGEMAGGLAHEINNPLMIIDGKTQLLHNQLQRNPPGVAQALSFTGSIHDAVARITKIVKGLRAFARQSEGEPYLPTNIGNVIDDVVALCAERLRHNNIKVSHPSPEPPIFVECREPEIAQILANLINNASDAVLELEERWIAIETSENGDFVDVVVTDSGKGLSPEVADKIFRPFFTTKDVGRGVGLGLSIAKGLAESHNGRLWLDGQARHTRFVLRLPKKQPSPEHDASRPAAQTQAAPPP